MPSLILTLALLGQCPSGVCPPARFPVPQVRATYTATPNYSAVPNSCTAPRRVFGIFRRRQCR